MDFSARLAEHGCGSPAREALAAYFAAVNAPPGPAKLEGVLAAFEAEGSTVVNNSAAPVSPRAFYDSPSSPVLSEGFRAEPDFASLVCSADGRTVAISIRLVPGGREADAFLVGDWFTVGPSGALLQRLLIHGAPAAAPARPGTKRPREPAPAGGGVATAAAAPHRQLVLAEAVPYAFTFPLRQTALLLIDFQRDFLLPGGFGESLGNDVSHLMRAVKPAAAALRAARACGMTVAHTREGHVPDLSDLPRSKLHRGNPPPGKRIGDVGGMGRILVDGEVGCAIVPELEPKEGELDLLKPGKGAFYNTRLEAWLRERGVTHLLVCGVTTEVCVQTTLREANDRGFDSCVLADACASYFPDFHEQAMAMFTAQCGIVGWSASTEQLEAALAPHAQ